jgi:hypothetical protein
MGGHMARTCRVLAIAGVLTFALASLALSSAHAGPRDHEEGFFLRLSAGAGGGGTKLDASDALVDLSGGTGNVNLAIGGVITSNLALHATIFGWTMENPDATLEGITGTFPGDISLYALGIGLTYYVMPHNIYLSGSLGGGTIEVESFGLRGETESGLALDMTLGKEWWVSDRWGLGVAGGIGYHSISQEDADENWSGVDVAIRFTSTFN